MNGQTVLITGGAGLIGSHIAEALAGEGVAEVRVLDNFVRGRRANLEAAAGLVPLQIIEGDIREVEAVRSAMEGVHTLFHQAAIRITQCAQEPRLAFDVLSTGTFNVLEAAAEAGVKKVVAASSASIYGMANVFPTTEDHHSYNNRTLYGAAKAFNEGLLSSFHEMYGMPTVALRYFNVYGERMDIHGAYTEVLVRWMERIARSEAPLIFGDGKQTMDFVHVADIARANVLAAKADIKHGAFNVATGVETSLLGLAQALQRAMGADLPIEHRAERNVNPVPRRLADTARARQELGFEAAIGLEEGLRRLVAWWRAEQDRDA